MTKLAEIARTISLFAQPGMKPKALMTAVRERHPDASKKDISRGAFFAVILAAENDPHKVSVLHDIAMAARTGGDGSADADAQPEKKKRRSKPTAH